MPLALNIGDQFWLKEPTPGAGIGIAAGGEDSCYYSLGNFISCVLPNIYVVSGLILFFLLIFGGLSYIVSAGKGDQEGAKKGQQTITAALLGFVLIFASWWLLEIIKIVTGVDIFSGIWGV